MSGNPHHTWYEPPLYLYEDEDEDKNYSDDLYEESLDLDEEEIEVHKFYEGEGL